jgi:hypothetical protein
MYGKTCDPLPGLTFYGQHQRSHERCGRREGEHDEMMLVVLRISEEI